MAERGSSEGAGDGALCRSSREERDGAAGGRRPAARERGRLDDLGADRDCDLLRRAGADRRGRSARGSGRGRPRRRLRRAAAPRGPRSSPCCPSRRCRRRASRSAAISAGTSNFGSCVSTQMTVRGVDRRAREEAVGPLDDELVRLGEPLRRDEGGARVADGDAVAEQLADARERTRHGRSRRRRTSPGAAERVHEHRLALDVRRARSRPPRRRRATAPAGCSCSSLVADPLAGGDDVSAAGRSSATARASARDEGRVERCDQDPDRAAAGEADLERRRRRRSRTRAAARAPPSSTSCASRITAGSTQPPVTEPAISPRSFSASDAPGSRGAEPRRSTTVAIATRRPSACQRTSVGRMSRTVSR